MRRHYGDVPKPRRSFVQAGFPHEPAKAIIAGMTESSQTSMPKSDLNAGTGELRAELRELRLEMRTSFAATRSEIEATIADSLAAIERVRIDLIRSIICIAFSAAGLAVGLVKLLG